MLKFLLSKITPFSLSLLSVPQLLILIESHSAPDIMGTDFHVIYVIHFLLEVRLFFWFCTLTLVCSGVLCNTLLGNKNKVIINKNCSLTKWTFKNFQTAFNLSLFNKPSMHSILCLNKSELNKITRIQALTDA